MTVEEEKLPVRVAVVQTNPTFGEIEANVRDAVVLMEDVEADLFVLPELFNTGYNFVDVQEVERLSEHTSGFTFDHLSTFARRKSCYVVYGFVEKAVRLFNSASLVGPFGMMGLYRKVHLFDRETLFFAPGDLGFPVFNLPIGRIGIMICFDWIYPESARSLALKAHSSLRTHRTLFFRIVPTRWSQEVWKIGSLRPRPTGSGPRHGEGIL